MPYPGISSDKTAAMDKCVQKIMAQGHDKSSAVAICNASITGKDTGDTSPNASYAFGPGGLLNTPGLGAGKRGKKKVMSAMVKESPVVTSIKELFGAKSTWTAADINNFPDGNFLYVEPGGKKDSDGKTVPRTLRHFPYKNADGGVDLPHLRNALQRIPQAKIPADKKVSLTKRAQDLLAKANENKELDGSLTVEKQADGSYRYVIKSSNAYEDHDGEIVSEKSLSDDCDLSDATGNHPPLRWWHLGDLNQGVDLGHGDYGVVLGRFRIDSGTFYDESVGQAMKEHASQLAASIGFNHPKTEPDAEGIYHKIHVFEVSLLPRQNAANPFTAVDVLKENDMKSFEEKVKELAAIVGGHKAQEIVASVQAQQKQLDPLVKHKEQTPAEVSQQATLEQIAQAALTAPLSVVTEKGNQRGAMFAQMKKAGTYDEVKARGGPPATAKPAPADAPDTPAQEAAETPADEAAESPAKQAAEAAAGVEKPIGKKDDMWGEGDGMAGDTGAPVDEAAPPDISGMTVADVHAAIATALAELIMSSKELKEFVVKEVGAQLATVEVPRTKEANTVTQKLGDLNKRVKSLEGDADIPTGYRASREGAVVGQGHALKESQPYIDPLAREALAGLFGSNGQS